MKTRLQTEIGESCASRRVADGVPSFRKVSCRLGFSLPEVVLAMAIASLAITTLLGLVPSGLNSLREAGAAIVETSAFRQMIGEIQSADWGAPGGSDPGWSGLQPYNNERRYYDDQGSPIASDDRQILSSRLAFVARFTFPPRAVELPGAAAVAAATGRNMLFLTIDIAQSANPDYAFSDPSLFKSRTVVVTRQH